MTLAVMLNGGICLGPVASWKGGVKELAKEGGNTQPDVQLVVGGGSDPSSPAFAALVHVMVPWAGKHFTQDRGTVGVQSFRCVGLAGNAHHVLFCVDCGYVHRTDDMNVGGVGIKPCPRCTCSPIGEACPRFHNWGRCGDCRPTLAEQSRAMEEAAAAPSRARRRDAGRASCASSVGGPPATKGGALGILAGSASGVPTRLDATG